MRSTSTVACVIQVVGLEIPTKRRNQIRPLDGCSSLSQCATKRNGELNADTGRGARFGSGTASINDYSGSCFTFPCRSYPRR